MASRNINDLEPTTRRLCQELLAECAYEGLSVFLTCTKRSNEEQDELYAQGRTKPGRKVTNAKAGQSAHNFGMAFDIAIKNKDGSLCWDKNDIRWHKAGAIGERCGLEWGGRWRMQDLPHFERKNWKQMKG